MPLSLRLRPLLFTARLRGRPLLLRLLPHLSLLCALLLALSGGGLRALRRGLTLGIPLRLLLLTEPDTLALRALPLGPVVRGLRHGCLRGLLPLLPLLLNDGALLLPILTT